MHTFLLKNKILSIRIFFLPLFSIYFLKLLNQVSNQNLIEKKKSKIKKILAIVVFFFFAFYTLISPNLQIILKFLLHAWVDLKE